RNDRKGNSFGVNDLTHALANLTQSQTGIKTKINTVINSLNWEEDFSNLISSLKPYKWKVLQVMPYGDNEMLISKEQFDNFVLRHSGLGLPMYSESNSTMTESYLMISPEGCFYQNTANKPGYKYSECINSCGVEKALSQIEFNPITFASRYKETNIDIIELS
ncbi:TPA: radical SAM protein, partial [Vibrio parahaemolyticus]|nr:radical SAM protein [Vibrio parahaemolyticus]